MSLESLQSVYQRQGVGGIANWQPVKLQVRTGLLKENSSQIKISNYYIVLKLTQSKKLSLLGFWSGESGFLLLSGKLPAFLANKLFQSRHKCLSWRTSLLYSVQLYYLVFNISLIKYPFKTQHILTFILIYYTF